MADAGLRFGQVQMGGKTNEKTAISALLEALDVAGRIVPIAAIACQPSIVERVVAAGADDVIALKKNAKNLFEQVHDHVLARRDHLPHHRSRNRGHGRGEDRTVTICQDLSWREAPADWQALHTRVLVETERHTGTGTTYSQRFSISSLTNS